jgi:hypothetical protein
MHLKATNFEKSIKRDKTQYQEIKDERNFYTWERSFMTTARSQQIQDVFRPEYVPISAAELDLFNRKQEYAFSVLDHVLKTSDGNALLRKHYDSNNAQELWKEFVANAKISTKAKHVRSEILKWITSPTFDSSWKGSAHNFILYWVNKVQEYETFITNMNIFLVKNKIADDLEHCF